MKPQIIFFDIDDTLYHKKEQQVPQSVINTVFPALQRADIKIAIATGRCVGAFPQQIIKLINQGFVDALVSINGNANYLIEQNNGAMTPLSLSPLPNERIEQVIAGLNNLNIPYGLVASDEMAVSTLSDGVIASMPAIKKDFITDPYFYQHNAIYQMLAFYPPPSDDTIIASNILGDDLKTVRWHQWAVDILDKNTSKIKGIFEVLDHFAITKERAMAFGDGLNDVEMIAQIGCGVAMGNAVQAVKNVADFTTARIEDDGIVRALQHFNLI